MHQRKQKLNQLLRQQRRNKMFDITGTVTPTNPNLGNDAAAGTNLPVRPTEVK